MIIRFFFLCLIIFSQPVLAQSLLDSLRKDLPVFDPLEEQVFLDATMLTKETPHNVPSLGFEVRLPKGWRKIESFSLGEFTLKPKVLSEVSRHVGPSDLYGLKAFFTLDVEQLENSLTAEQWMAEYMRVNNYTSQGFKTHSENRVEAVFVYVERGDSYIVRAIAQRNGNIMMLARFIIPEGEWGEVRALQAASVQSFEATHENKDVAEVMEVFQFLDIAEAAYPASWEFMPGDLRSIDRMNATLFNVTKRQEKHKQVRTFEGKVSLNLVSSYIANDLEVEIDALKDSMMSEAITIMEEIEDVPQWTYGDYVSFANNSLFRAQSSQDGATKDFELWVTIIGLGEYYYLASLLTPSRDENFSVWARNTQGYQLMLRSTRLLNSDRYAE